MKRLDDVIPNDFIYHFNKTSYGVSYTIMSIYGWALGTIYFYLDDPTTLYLCGLSVEELHRRTGLATTILNIFEAFGIEAGYENLCLEVEDNSWVKEWYIRKGFVEQPNDYQICDHRYPSVDEVWMKKELKQNNKDGFKD